MKKLKNREVMGFAHSKLVAEPGWFLCAWASVLVLQALAR